MEASWLEVVLKREARSNAVEKVVSVEREEVVTKGENYASQMTRLKMKVLLGSGLMATRSVIVKEMPSVEISARHLKEWGLFKKEIKVGNLIRVSNSAIITK